MIWIATMELKWVEEEITREGKDFDGKSWITLTGEYKKILYQKFKNNEGDAEWRIVPTD